MREKETFRSINELITYLAGPTAPGLALHDRIDVNSGLIAFFRPPFKVDFAKRPSYGQSSNRCRIIFIALKLSGFFEYGVSPTYGCKIIQLQTQ